LRNGDNVDLFARDGSEYTAGQTGSPAHSFAHDGEQADVFIDLNGL